MGLFCKKKPYWQRREQAAELIDSLIDDENKRALVHNDELRLRIVKLERQVREVTTERDALQRLLTPTTERLDDLEREG